MTAQTRSALKDQFEQGDTPQGTDYVDLIDSFLSLADTSAQTVASPLTISGVLGAQTVTAANVGATTVSADNVQATTVSAATASFDTLLVAGEEVRPPSGAVSTGEIFLTATAAAIASGAGSYSIMSGDFSAVSMFNLRTSASPTLAEIEYTGTATAVFFATAYFSVKASGTNKLSGWRIGVNASSLSRTQIRRFISSTTDVGAGAVGGSVQLATGDKASLMYTNLTDTVGFAVTDVIFQLVEKV